MEDNKMELKKTLLKNLLRTLDDGDATKIKDGKSASIGVVSVSKPEEDTEEECSDMPEMETEETGEEELEDSDILEKLKKLLGE